MRGAHLALLAVIPASLAWAALLGLGIHRHGAPWAVALSAVVLLFLPPAAVALASRDRWSVGGGALGIWSLCLLAILPVYFPGERSAAIATGVGIVFGDEAARSVASNLPEEIPLASPQAELATVSAPDPLPEPLALEANEIALPFEGQGRRLSVPVVFTHGENVVEVDMMLDTGATYTTLPLDVLARLGIRPGPDAPVIELHTANGVRRASLVLVDEVWLGDIAVRGVAIATCEECALSETVGLLGLNVAGAFNMNIDSDRREVIFTTRARHDRQLDVRRFMDLSARFRPYRGGRIEVDVEVSNRAAREIAQVIAGVSCEDQRWEIEVGAVGALEEVQVRRRLPEHERCERYGIELSFATW